jgi:hypothetical protein
VVWAGKQTAMIADLSWNQKLLYFQGRRDAANLTGQVVPHDSYIDARPTQALTFGSGVS